MSEFNLSEFGKIVYSEDVKEEIRNQYLLDKFNKKWDKEKEDLK